LQESESPAVAAAVASPARREEPTEEPATAAASVAAPVGAEEPTEGHPDGLAVFRALDVDEGSHAVREAAGLGDQAKGVLVRIAACLAGLLVRA